MWVGIVCLVFREKSGPKVLDERSWDEESEKGGGVEKDVSLPL